MKNAKRLNNENLQLKAELLAAAELVESKDKAINNLDLIIKGHEIRRGEMARMLTDKDTAINEMVADKVALCEENALLEKKFKRFRIIHLTGELVALALIAGSFFI